MLSPQTTSVRQAPIGSGLGAATTTEEVIDGIDLRGKIAMVTGGYSGIGLETARAFHNAGAKVIVPARDRDRAASAVAGLAGLEVETLDLLDPASITAFTERYRASGRPLHLLVNSAGIMASPKTLDPRGYEIQFATNHLGHFQLVEGLWSSLVKAQGARVVSVSSLGHRFSPVVFEDIHFEHREYDRWSAYGQSKTANILFALALDERGQRDRVRAFSVHPGTIVGTNLKRYLSDDDIRAFGVLDDNGAPIRDPSRNFKTPSQGAATQVWCATNPRLDGLGGVYCENCEVANVNSETGPQSISIDRSLGLQQGVMPYAIDQDAAVRLWVVSQDLIGRSR